MAAGGRAEAGLLNAALRFFKKAPAKIGRAAPKKPALPKFVEYHGPAMRYNKSLMPKYGGEAIGFSEEFPGQRVKYLTDAEERELYRLNAGEDGRLYWGGERLDTTDINTARSEGRCIYVMDPSGKFYVSKWQSPGQFHHSSLLRGWPAAAAGEMRVVDGKLEYINDWSGHYQPFGRNTDQALTVLNHLGIDISSVRVEYAATHW
jgi:hypothetical protein